MNNENSITGRRFSAVQLLLAPVLLACMLAVSGCGGTDTKVINAQKTLVMRDSIYNITDFQVYKSQFVGVLSETETVDLRAIEKREFNDLVDQYGSINVRSLFTFDDKEVVYRANRIDSWGDLRDMRRSFERAEEDVREFLGDPEEHQLELD